MASFVAKACPVLLERGARRQVGLAARRARTRTSPAALWRSWRISWSSRAVHMVFHSCLLFEQKHFMLFKISERSNSQRKGVDVDLNIKIEYFYLLFHTLRQHLSALQIENTRA